MRGSRDACEACDGGIVAHLSPERQMCPYLPVNAAPAQTDHTSRQATSTWGMCPSMSGVTIGLVRPYFRASLFRIGHHQNEKGAPKDRARKAAHLHPLADVRRLRTGSSSH